MAGFFRVLAGAALLKKIYRKPVRIRDYRLSSGTRYPLITKGRS